MRKKILELLESDITGYRINKDNPNVPQNLISRLRTKSNKLDNITLKTAEDLCAAHDFYFKEQ